MERSDNADHHGTAANGRGTDIGQRDLPVREKAEGALMAGIGAAEIVGLPMRGAERYRGGKKQQQGQQTSEG